MLPNHSRFQFVIVPFVIQGLNSCRLVRVWLYLPTYLPRKIGRYTTEVLHHINNSQLSFQDHNLT